jgi:hypothetical protein
VKLFKIIFKLIAAFCIFIISLLILQFVVNSKYRFSEPHPFKGDYVYNPYRYIDNSKWRRAGFHSHTHKFIGQPKKSLRIAQIMDSLYKCFDYNIIGLSDYQSINRFEDKNKCFVPVYEHGYQYYKNHQLVINPGRVTWLDFPFPQTLSNKQEVINKLRKDGTSLITIVHPVFRKAYSNNDFKYLANYNCLEIANHDRIFAPVYDTILSHGHPVFIMADDDAHELTNINEICSSFNLINSDLVKDSVLNALGSGRSIGVKFNIGSIQTCEEKVAALRKLPKICNISFRNDTLSVSLNMEVNTIKFIGQSGKEKKEITDTSSGSCYFSKQDTYLRTEIECRDGTIYFLNPVFRYNGIHLADYALVFDTFKTWGLRSAVICFLPLIALIWFRRK